MSLWSEIKQRRITQIVVGYLVGGWIVVSVVDQPVDRGVLPGVVYEVVLALYLFGILGALIIGWYHGEKGEQTAPKAEIAMLAVIGLIAVGTSGWIVRRSLEEATLRDAIMASGLDLRSIGVLYLEDMTADGSIQPVADAITEGLIGDLAQVRELDVASRNASGRVRELDVSRDSIARILDVGTLVDGTIDQVGDEIRVSVRLLEGQTGVPFFRDSYAWPADEVAQVSGELATEVANALREQLGVEVRLRQSQAAAPNAAAWLQVARAEELIKRAKEALAEGGADAVASAFDAAEAALITAQEAAPEWADPFVLRAEVAYERWILTETDEEELATLAQAVEFANQAIALEPDNAAALEWRGTAQYRRFLMEVEDEDVLNDVLANARADLERSIRLDPSRASVNSTLSHLYYNSDEWAQAVIAAREAYSQDAFLDVADQVVWRLFQASHDLGAYQEARQWCLEGRRRFPDSFRFVQCQIQLLTMKEADPDVAEAWALLAQLPSMMPPGDQSTLIQGLAQTWIGGVIGRAGLADSADAVMTRARVGSDIDRSDEQMFMEAAMRSITGDVDGGIRLLSRYVIGHPGHYPGEHWWWENLEGDPRFEQLQFAR